MTADACRHCIKRPDKELSARFLLLQAEIHDSFSAGLIRNGVATCLFLYQH